jgi:hypothetical protein
MTTTTTAPLSPLDMTDAQLSAAWDAVREGQEEWAADLANEMERRGFHDAPEDW